MTSAACILGYGTLNSGHLWTAKWWSYADVPGGAAGDWSDDGACTSFAAAIPTAHKAAMSAAQHTPAPAPTTA